MLTLKNRSVWPMWPNLAMVWFQLIFPPIYQSTALHSLRGGLRLAGSLQVLKMRFKSGRSAVVFQVTSDTGKLS